MRRCLGRFPHGIVVNGVLPGPTTTPMLIKEDTNKIALNEASVPIGRYVIPKEIANMEILLWAILYMTGGASLVTFEGINYNIT